MSKMSQREASALRRIVRERFKTIRRQIPEVARQECARRIGLVDAEFDAVVWQAQDAGAALAGEYEELAERINRHVDDCQRAGLVGKSRLWSETVRHPDLVRSILTEWRSSAADEMVRQITSEISDAKQRAEMAASIRESALIEQLTLREITSDEAINFLGEIPSAQGMITGLEGSDARALLEGAS